MPKFFVCPDNISGDNIIITGDDVKHITKVLRMKAGDDIIVCDGAGFDYCAKILSTDNNRLSATVLRKEQCLAEPKTRVMLYQALPKQGKMEYIIQKNTELGVSEIIPVYTKRCVAKPSNKTKRWQKIALEAAKQCGRGIVPRITEAVNFNEAIKQMNKYKHRIMLYECEEQNRPRDILSKRADEIAVLVGCEGGFDDDEVQTARQSGIITITLGKRILRCETAAAAVLPIIMYENEDL